jgi:NAD-dependent dihydropyrimidine dehydrogenase PreA subunit
MIELVSAERCTGCNICVSVCPTNVFDSVEDMPPVIARQGDCQTCFMCELYCPVDALYVAHDANLAVAVDERALGETQVLGSYRKAIGWSADSRARRTSDRSYLLLKPH